MAEEQLRKNSQKDHQGQDALAKTRGGICPRTIQGQAIIKPLLNPIQIQDEGLSIAEDGEGTDGMAGGTIE